jgi:diguanylate cyclase (GGDEF)-like protein/PAS domain S-box-containing protein
MEHTNEPKGQFPYHCHSDFIKILTTSTTPALDTLSSELFGTKSEAITLPQFEIDTASQGREGVARIKTAFDQGEPYALAFVDIRMPPGWDGVETIKHIWEIDKDIQVVICTAYSDYTWEETVGELGQTDNLLILKKPFDNVSVRQFASALTRKWQLIQNARAYTDDLKQQVADRTQSLQTSLSLVKATLESSGDGIMVVNTDGIIVDHNQKFVEMWNLNSENVIGQDELTILDKVKDTLKNPAACYERLKELRSSVDEISLDVMKFNDDRIFECYSQPHKLENETVGRVFDFRDITKRARLEKELLHQATHDSLTGLPNRIFLMKHVQETIHKAHNDENFKSFALLFLDLDRFKIINDSLSHEVGDDLLKAATCRLHGALEEKDILVRLGGDEFVIALMEIKNEKDITSRLQKITASFKEPFPLGGRQITVTSSIGVSLYPKDGKTVDELLRNSDAAMYKAKSLMGNNFQFYKPEMSLKSLDKLEQENQLRHALANEEFFLVYQPQLDLAGENMVALQALLRWKHPEKGTLLPMDFISIGEETGLIVPIGEWMIRTACAKNKAWQNQGTPKISIAVNVTAQQLKQENFVQVIHDILKETGLEPQYLGLELTEDLIVSNSDLVDTIIKLKELGVLIIIGGFGTGYSNLSYLQKVPLDRLKIDRSFIQQISAKGDDEIIIRAVIAMAKSLHLKVFAEGIETTNQLEFIKKYEDEDMHGFYFGKPLTQNEIENIFKDPANIKKMTTFLAPPT